MGRVCVCVFFFNGLLVEQDDTMFILMEYADAGDLFSTVKCRGPQLRGRNQQRHDVRPKAGFVKG